MIAPRTVPYATRARDGHEWEADVYAPDGIARAPTAIVLPGEGSSRVTPAFRDMGSALAGRGIVAVVADHWPAPGARIMGEGGGGFREAVENAVWLVGSAAELTGIEAERLVVYGQSAGGVNGLFVALEGDGAIAAWDAYCGGAITQQTSGSTTGGFKVDGFVGLNGGYEAPYAMRSLNADLGTFMSPFSRLERPARVLRFVVGSRDEVIPSPIQARHKELFEALRGAGHDVAVTTVDDGHIPTTGSPGWQASVDAITGLATEMQ